MNPRRDLHLVSAALLTWGLGEGLFLVFQTIYLLQLGASTALVGLLLGANAVMMMLAQIPAGYLADRFGRRPVMWVNWGMGVVSTLVMALATSLGVFVAGMLVYSLTAAVMAPMNSYIVHARGDWSVGKAVSMTSAAYNVGAVLGPLLGGLIADRFGIRQNFFIATAIFMLSTLIVLLIRRQPVEAARHESAITSLLKNKPFMLALGLILMVIFVLYLPIPLTSVFLRSERGVSLGAIGRLGALQSVGNVVFLLVLGHLPALPVFVISQVALFAFSLLLWRGSGLGLYGVGFFLLGGYRIGRAMTLSLIRPLVSDDQVGLAFGFVETVNSLSAILAPVLAGLLYDRSPAAIYPISMALLAISGVITLIVRRSIPRIKSRLTLENTSQLPEVFEAELETQLALEERKSP